MKQHRAFTAFGALFLCALVLCSLLSRTATSLGVSVSEKGEDRTPVIILDAGHGGEDGGASGTNGILEKDLNLALTTTLAHLLRGAGYTVVETRTTDTLLYTPGTKKGHKKQGDLENRLAFCERYENSIFVSVHMNTFPNDSCMGLQVWYSQNNDASDSLASAVQDTVRTLLQPQNNRRIKASTSSIYLLRHAKNPAILIECGFLSTPAECERLSNEAYRRALALCIFSAIDKNLQSNSCEKNAPMI